MSCNEGGGHANPYASGSQLPVVKVVEGDSKSTVRPRRSSLKFDAPPEQLASLSGSGKKFEMERENSNASSTLKIIAPGEPGAPPQEDGRHTPSSPTKRPMKRRLSFSDDTGLPLQKVSTTSANHYPLRNNSNSRMHGVYVDQDLDVENGHADAYGHHVPVHKSTSRFRFLAILTFLVALGFVLFFAFQPADQTSAPTVSPTASNVNASTANVNATGPSGRVLARLYLREQN